MQIIGHRGAKGLAPENTIQSIQKALQHHVDELEFDVHVTKDNVAVLSHDATITDPGGKRLTIAETTYKELLAHKPNLATLEEVFKVGGPDMQYYIEIKPRVTVAPVVKLIKKQLAAGWSIDRLAVGSYSQKVLRAVQKQLPELDLIVIGHWSAVWATHRARQLNTKRISLSYRWLWWGVIKGLSDGGYKLNAYSINDPAKAQHWASYGLYGVVTDYPDRYEA